MIRKILIANRGVNALRILSTCRRLGIKSVAVYSDAEKGAPHAHLADEAVPLGPAEGSPTQPLLEAARKTGGMPFIPDAALWPRMRVLPLPARPEG